MLYFLSADGRPIDFAQRRSLDEVMAEVDAIVGTGAWRTCSLQLDDDWDRLSRQSVA